MTGVPQAQEVLEGKDSSGGACPLLVGPTDPSMPALHLILVTRMNLQNIYGEAESGHWPPSWRTDGGHCGHWVPLVADAT